MTDNPLLQNGTAAYSAAVTNPRYGRRAAPKESEHSTTLNTGPVIPQGAHCADQAHRRY